MAAVGLARSSADGHAKVESALRFVATGCGGEQKSAMTGMYIRSMVAVRRVWWSRHTSVGVRGRTGSVGAPGTNATRDAAQGDGPRNLQRNVTTATSGAQMDAAVHAGLNVDGRARVEMRVLRTAAEHLNVEIRSLGVMRSAMMGTRSTGTGAHHHAAESLDSCACTTLHQNIRVVHMLTGAPQCAGMAVLWGAR